MKLQTMIALDANGDMLDEAQIVPPRASARRLKKLFARRADVARVIRITTEEKRP
ncbi:hypothetical protein [Rhodopseudomonas sp. BR0G17]|uniref:hypothetical protein n=1 Tax=Rhodopseudomonas sp. BR0G17 TaxID=2269368 RepID=UPI0013DE8130|nr:hypothetical protein [Rhodopseudomonas sp. BR0G17]